MRLTLLLLRHAKAVPQGGDDFARVLTDTGHAGARRIGLFLSEHGLVPDLALVSPAARTRETFDDLAPAQPVLVRYEAPLYNSSRRDLQTRTGQTGPEVETLLIIGHNPGILEFALHMSRDGDPRDIEAMHGSFPPASLAVIAFEAQNWREAAESGGELIAFVTPDRLDGPR